MGNMKFSFEQWCLENNRQDYLDLWDYELNEKKPNEVAKSASKKYWFKCENGIHGSYMLDLANVCNVNRNGIECLECKSIIQYIKDEYGEMATKMVNSDRMLEYSKIGKMSHKKIKIVCPVCGKENEQMCQNFFRQGLFCQCSDGISYPNKFITSFLNQLGIEFEVEKVFEYAKDKRYDHFINSKCTLIENHGEQHYKEKIAFGMNLEEQKENDKLKRKLALSNGIKHYIELDCRKSDVEWIKNSVMTSELPAILNFKEEDIDWVECGRFATSNILIDSCNMWNNGNSVFEIAKECKVDVSTVRNWLNRGYKLGICGYDSKIELKRTQFKKGNTPIYTHKRKIVKIYKDGIFLKEVEGYLAVIEYVNDKFGVVLSKSKIGEVLNGRRRQHKGFIFK